MVEEQGTIAAAARLLAQHGQLRAVVVRSPGGDRLVRLDQGAWPHLQAAYAGAGLDSRTLRPGELFVALPGTAADGRRFVPEVLAEGHWALCGLQPALDPPAEWLDAAVASEVVSALASEVVSQIAPESAQAASAVAVPAGVLVCADAQTALQLLAADRRARWPGRVVGITGTNGKTTTKDFCAAMLGGPDRVCATAGNLNNRLGVPLTLLRLGGGHDFAVVEMGASAVGEIAGLAGLARPQVGIITNASPAHLAEFGSLQGIIAGKGELLDALPPDGRAILNADSPGFTEWAARSPCPVVSWGLKCGDHRWSWQPLPAGGGQVELDGRTWPVPLPGAHNGANLVAALLAAAALGLPEAAVRTGLAGFAGSPHRGVILTWAGRTILDDSYNANPRSMVAAGRALGALAGTGRRIAVLGPMAELGPRSEELHRQCGQDLVGGGADVVVAVGPAARPLAEGFDPRGQRSHYFPALPEAAAWLALHTAPGDILLVKGSRSAGMENLIPLLQRQGDR